MNIFNIFKSKQIKNEHDQLLEDVQNLLNRIDKLSFYDAESKIMDILFEHICFKIVYKKKYDAGRYYSEKSKEDIFKYIIDKFNKIYDKTILVKETSELYGYEVVKKKTK
jgi:folate-dependent tRNA-U54 methylase TrmFO/GidA